LKSKHLLSVSDLSSDEISSLLSNAADMKTEGWSSILSEKIVAIMFEKPSLRTRVSFEVATRQLGGQTVYLSPAEVGIGKRESPADVARVLGRYVDAIVARTFSHQTLEIFAEYSGVPVINALSDMGHPCQALADFLTIQEKKGTLRGVTLSYVGDGNNVANSLMLAASLVGVDFRIATPVGYEVQDKILRLAQDNAARNGSSIFCTTEPRVAVEKADVIYTDVWTSMGQEDETEKRRRIFDGYQVNDELVSLAAPDVMLMHPLPAHHGEEVAEGILDSDRSVVFDEAENRLHAQKAVLVEMLGGLEIPSSKY